MFKIKKFNNKQANKYNQNWIAIYDSMEYSEEEINNYTNLFSYGIIESVGNIVFISMKDWKRLCDIFKIKGGKND